LSLMKVAVFSDVHGNALALDAVLADIALIGVDAFWVVGDLVANGPDPAGPIRKLRSLPNALFVRGNTDRKTLTGPNPAGTGMGFPAEPTKLRNLIETQQNFAWTRGAITAVGALDWLAAIPLEQRVTLPDGTRVLIVHAAPGHDDGPGINPQLNNQGIATALDGCDANLVIVGHTHKPLDKTVNGMRAFAVGSVSLPATSDRRAMWTLLRLEEDGFQLERHFVEYDIDQVVRALDQVRHPAAETLKRKFTGS